MTTPPTSETLRTPMQITWQFDYEIDIAELRNLHSRSKRAQRDAELRVGAVTRCTHELFERQGIPVWDDVPVLESLGDAETGDIDMSRAA